MTRASRLRSSSVEERAAAIAELADAVGADEAEIAALIDCLGHERKAIQRPAAEAAAALARRGVPVRGALYAALAEEPFRRRWGVAYALARLGDPPAAILPVLLEALGCDDGDIRWASAAIALGLADREAVLSALSTLLRAGNPAQRKMALYCLRDLEVRTPGVEAAATGALDDADAGVRLAAVSSLPRLACDRSAVAIRLLATLERGTDQERRAAGAALGTLGERSAEVLAALEVAAASGDQGLRRASARSLRLLSRP